MHYKYIYGKFNVILPYSRLIVDEHYNEWKDSSDPAKDITTRFNQLCGKFGREAYWIIVVDTFWQVVGTCTLGDENDEYLQLYNLLVTKDYRKCGFATHMIDLARAYAQDKNKKIFGFVEKEKMLFELYKKHGAIETELFKRDGYIALTL